jgi:hypothetical protein
VVDGVAITTTSSVAGAGGTHDTAGVTAVVVDSFQGWQWVDLWGTFIRIQRALPRRCLLRTCAALHCTAASLLLPVCLSATACCLSATTSVPLCQHLLPLCYCHCASLPPPAASLLLPLCISATTCCLSATASASRFIRQFSQQPLRPACFASCPTHSAAAASSAYGPTTYVERPVYVAPPQTVVVEQPQSVAYVAAPGSGIVRVGPHYGPGPYKRVILPFDK